MNAVGERKSEKSPSLGVVGWLDGAFIPKSGVCILLVTKNQELLISYFTLKVVKATLCEGLTYVTYMKMNLFPNQAKFFIVLKPNQTTTG